MALHLWQPGLDFHLSAKLPAAEAATRPPVIRPFTLCPYFPFALYNRIPPRFSLRGMLSYRIPSPASPATVCGGFKKRYNWGTPGGSIG